MKRLPLLLVLGVVVAVAAWFFFRPTPTEKLSAHTRVSVQEEAVRAPAPAAPVVGDKASSASTPAHPDTTAAAAEEAADRGLESDVVDVVPELEDAGVELSAWPLTQDGIRGAIREVGPVVALCYQDALRQNPDLGGRATVGFAIKDQDGIGRVVGSQIEENDMEAEGLTDCITRAMSVLQFDAPEDGESTVTWPFVFRPQKKKQ